MEQNGGTVEQCGTAWRNSSSVSTCGGKVWNSMVKEWNSVERYGGAVEQYGRTVEQYGGTVQQYGETME